MDIRLPYVTGFDLIQSLKSEDDLKLIAVVAVTGIATRKDEVRILAGGFDAYLCKPVSVANYLKTVERFMPPVWAG